MNGALESIGRILDQVYRDAYDKGVADERERVKKLIAGERPEAPEREPPDRWTREDDAELERLWETTDLSAEKIGAKLGRTAQAIYTRAKIRELKPRLPRTVTQIQGAPGPRAKVLPPALDALAVASKLPPLTQVQAAVFRGLVLALEEGDPPASFGQINRLGKVTGANSYVMRQLADLGYVKMNGDLGAPDWRPIAVGEPRVKVPVDGDGNVVRPWTDEEVGGLALLNPDDGDTYLDYGRKISRTEHAVQEKARSRGWYVAALVSTNSRLRRKPVALPAPAAPQQEEAPTDGVDLDDLAKAPREILLSLRALKEPSTVAAVRGFADVDNPIRFTAGLGRCRELGLVEGDDLIRLTALGSRLADQVHAEEGS